MHHKHAVYLHWTTNEWVINVLVPLIGSPPQILFSLCSLVTRALNPRSLAKKVRLFLHIFLSLFEALLSHALPELAFSCHVPGKKKDWNNRGWRVATDGTSLLALTRWTWLGEEASRTILNTGHANWPRRAVQGWIRLNLRAGYSRLRNCRLVTHVIVCYLRNSIK